MRTVTNAKAVAIPGSTSGTYLTSELFPRLGIEDKINVKVAPRGAGVTAMVAAGDADLAIMPVSEILDVPGVDLAGTIPLEIQLIQVFSAAVVTGSKEADMGNRLIEFLASEGASAAIQKSGMEALGKRRRPLSDAAVKNELAPTGILRAAINYNNPLLAKRDAATGELSGLAVDLSRELARRVGVPLQLIPVDAAGKITSSAKDNVWDIGYLAIDPLRANDIDFAAAHVELEGTYMVPADSPLQRIEDVDREGVRIAVTAKSAYDLFLSRALKHAQIVRAENTPQSLVLMREQKLDAVAAVRTALIAEAKQLPGSRVLGGHFMTIPQAAGVPKGRPVAARYVREFIEEMKASGFVAATLKKHGLGPNDAIVAPPAVAK